MNSAYKNLAAKTLELLDIEVPSDYQLILSMLEQYSPLASSQTEVNIRTLVWEIAREIRGEGNVPRIESLIEELTNELLFIKWD